MMKKSIFILALSACLFLQNSFSQNIPERPKPGRAVNDFANLLDDFEEQRLERKLHDYNDSTSTQIVIVTVASLDGDVPQDYAATLGDKWGVGQKDKHNGVVILVSKNDHKGYIATGYGVEDGLNSNRCKDIYQNILVPNFRAGTFYNGFDLATNKMFEILSGKFINDEPKNNGDDISLGVLIGIILAFFIVLWILRKMGGNGGSHITSGGFFGPTFFPGGGSWGGGGSSGGGGGFDFGGGGFSGGGSGGDW